MVLPVKFFECLFHVVWRIPPDLSVPLTFPLSIPDPPPNGQPFDFPRHRR